MLNEKPVWKWVWDPATNATHEGLLDFLTRDLLGWCTGANHCTTTASHSAVAFPWYEDITCNCGKMWLWGRIVAIDTYSEAKAEGDKWDMFSLDQGH